VVGGSGSQCGGGRWAAVEPGMGGFKPGADDASEADSQFIDSAGDR
jgi:hypothetical protein